MGQEKTIHGWGIAGRGPLPVGARLDIGDSGRLRLRAGHGQCPGTFDDMGQVLQRDCRLNPARLLWPYSAFTLSILQSTQVRDTHAEPNSEGKLTWTSPVIMSQFNRRHLANCKAAAWICVG